VLRGLVGDVVAADFPAGIGDQVMKAPLRVQWAVLALGIFPSALAYLAWAYVLANMWT
jgi:hypothetical protein